MATQHCQWPAARTVNRAREEEEGREGCDNKEQRKARVNEEEEWRDDALKVKNILSVVSSRALSTAYFF